VVHGCPLIVNCQIYLSIAIRSVIIRGSWLSSNCQLSDLFGEAQNVWSSEIANITNFLWVAITGCSSHTSLLLTYLRHQLSPLLISISIVLLFQLQSPIAVIPQISCGNFWQLCLTSGVQMETGIDCYNQWIKSNQMYIVPYVASESEARYGVLQWTVCCCE